MKKFLSIVLIIVFGISILPMKMISLRASAATSGTTGDCTWSLDGTVLTISGEGAMRNYYYSSDLPWGTDITEVIIEKGVTSVSTYAFFGCNSLKSIVIPDSVTGIGSYAFYNCTGLVSVIIPNSITAIGEGAFYGCTSLESITLPFVGSSRTSNGTYDAVFGYIFGYTSSNVSGTTRQCYSDDSSRYYYIPSSLKSVTITDATQIPYGAFSTCRSLTSITISDGVTSIGEQAFYGCSSLTSITIPDSVTNMDEYAFYGCSSLISIAIPDSVTSIGRSTFENCTSLVSVKISKSIISIGESAFYRCFSITDIWYTGSQSDREKMYIYTYNNLTYATWHYNTCADEHTYTDCFDAICNNCDWERDITGHIFDNDCDFTCNVCSYERKIQHSFGDDDICVLCGCLKYTLGDIDGLEGVTDADAEYLLMHTFFPEDYPVNQTCDFNGDGKVNDADAEYLLMFTFFPEDYPLN